MGRWAAKIWIAAVFGLIAWANLAKGQSWDGFAGNAQHTALSTVASQPLDDIH
jgi:hypothetical protein